MAIEWGARSDQGRVRQNNEDSHRLAPEMNLFVLSDGMGGQASGEVASKLVTETIIAHCRDANGNPAQPLVGEPVSGASEVSNRLASAVRLANRVVHRAAQQNESHHGMGATVVVARFTGDRLSLVHVGDSRVYRLRAGKLEQLTEDHSFVAQQVRHGMMTAQEADQSNMQNVLLRALGVESEVEVEVSEEMLIEGDTFVLCSDGLTRELSDTQIAAVLHANEDAQKAADRLVDLANQAGGGDNITAMVVRYEPKPTSALQRIGRWFRDSSMNGGN